MAELDSSLRSLGDLVEVMRALRSEGGCPWDREQTHRSLKPFLVEEAAELLDAIDSGDDRHIQEELGDLLLQVVFHSRIAEDEGRFSLGDVAEGLVDKLKRRHPHVFAGHSARGAADVVRIWGEAKKAERGGQAPARPFAKFPRNLPALARASEVLRAAMGRGFAWPSLDALLSKLREELGELEAAARSGDSAAAAEEVGDLLLICASFCLFSGGPPPEEALRSAMDRFEARFEAMLAMAAKEGLDTDALPPARWLDLWTAAKAHHTRPSGAPAP